MAKKRVAMELGMGKYRCAGRLIYKKLPSGRYKTRCGTPRLWQMRLLREDMIVEVDIAVQKPEQVDIETVKAVLPYGQPHIRVVHGGLDIANHSAEGRGGRGYG